MIRGTKQTHIFKLPIDTGTISKIRITYVQSGKTVLEVTEDEVVMDDNEVRYRLSQEDTLKFKFPANVELQMKILMTDGSVMASPVIRLTVEKILNTEVLA